MSLFFYNDIGNSVGHAVPFFSGLQLYLDASDSSTITKAYRNLSATGSGTSGTTIITASANQTNLVQAGEKIRIGGIDIYTVASVSTVTINTVETLSTTYGAGSALALDRVSQWNDKSGNGNNATQGTALAQPIYTPNILNSKAVLIADGVSTFVLPSALYSLTNGPNTIFAVSKITSETGALKRLIDATEASSTRYTLQYAAVPGNTSFVSNNTGTNPVGLSGLTNTNFQIIMGRRSGATQAFSINGGAETTNANGADEPGIDAFYLFSQAGSFNFFIGSCAEILIYNRSLSVSEIAQINNYLSQKYAIS